jgi:hypothetical protein
MARSTFAAVALSLACCLAAAQAQLVYTGEQQDWCGPAADGIACNESRATLRAGALGMGMRDGAGAVRGSRVLLTC